MKNKEAKRLVSVMEKREEKFHFMKVQRPKGEIGPTINTEIGSCKVMNLSDEWVYIAITIDQLREISAKNL